MAPFANKYEPMKDVAIVSAVTGFTCTTDRQYILVFNEFLYIPKPNLSLSNTGTRQPLCGGSNEYHQPRRKIHFLFRFIGHQYISQYMSPNTITPRLDTTHWAHFATTMVTTKDCVSSNKVLCEGGYGVTKHFQSCHEFQTITRRSRIYTGCGWIGCYLHYTWLQ